MPDERFPENNKSTLYIAGREHTLGSILEQARQHWGADRDLEEMTIDVENIQFRCFGYDLYDAADHRDYTVCYLMTAED